MHRENIRLKIVESISCLLKFDWERSKKEIAVNYFTLLTSFTYIFTIILFALYSIFYKLTVDANILTWFAILFCYLTLEFFWNVYAIKFNHKYLDISKNGILRKRDFIPFFFSNQAISILCIILSILIAFNPGDPIFSPIDLKIITVWGLICLFCSFVNSIIMGFFCYHRWKEFKMYYAAINIILSK
jgi:hypothetical protein